MTDADEGRFEIVIAALAETFGAKLSPGQILGYRMGLDGLSLADIEAAIRRAIGTLKFMPKAAELRELAGEMTASVRAALAWEAAKKAVHMVSAYGSVDFADPVINAVIHNLGGWKAFCSRDAETFDTFTRKDFERVYLLFDAHGVDAERAAPCKGIHGEPVTKKFPVGYPVAKPRALPAVEKEAP